MLTRTFNTLRERLDQFLWTDAFGNRNVMRFRDQEIPVLRSGLLFVSYSILKRLIALIVLPFIHGFTFLLACGLCFALFPSFRDFAKSIFFTFIRDSLSTVFGIISNAILPIDTFLLRILIVVPLSIPGITVLFPTLTPTIVSLLNFITYSNMSIFRLNVYFLTMPVILGTAFNVLRKLSIINDILLYLPRRMNGYLENKLLQQDRFLNFKIKTKEEKINVLDKIINLQRIVATGVIGAYSIIYFVPSLALATPVFAVPIGVINFWVSWYLLSRWHSQRISNFKAIFSWADLIAKETSADEKEAEVIEFLQQLKADKQFTFGGINSQHALEQFLTILKINIRERVYGKMTDERMDAIEGTGVEYADVSSTLIYRVPVLIQVTDSGLDERGKPIEPNLDLDGNPIYAPVLSDGKPTYERNDLFSLLKVVENSAYKHSPLTRTPVWDITKQIKFDKQMYTFVRRKVYMNQPENIAKWEKAAEDADYSDVLAMLKAAPKLYDPSAGLLDPCIELAAALKEYNARNDLIPTPETRAAVCPLLGKIIVHPVVVNGKCYELLGVLNALTTSDKLASVDKNAAPRAKITFDEIRIGNIVPAQEVSLNTNTVSRQAVLLPAREAQQQNEQRVSYFAGFRLPIVGRFFNRAEAPPNAPSPNGSV